MTQVGTILIDVVLVSYIAREVWRFNGRYRRLKDAVARGDTAARSRLYRQGLVFEWVSAALALLALRFDWSALRPAALGLGGLPIVRALSLSSDAGRGMIMGTGIGIVLGTIGFFVARLRARKQGATPVAAARWQKLLPDFTAMLPVTAGERMLWLAVSISAGVCEEVVFRGWLLATLHGPVGLAGIGLLVAAALGFGLAHSYQGPSGMILTGLAGMLFCVLYVATGSLLIPMLLHTVIDARFALMPGPGQEGARRAGEPIAASGPLS